MILIELSRGDVVRKYADYTKRMELQYQSNNRHFPRSVLVKPITNMFFNVQRGKSYKNVLMENSRNRDMDIRDAILKSLDVFSEEVIANDGII